MLLKSPVRKNRTPGSVPGAPSNRCPYCDGQLSKELIILQQINEVNMQHDLSDEIGKLSIPERILLVEDIWDSIARENEAFELSQVQKDELDKRLRFFHENPSEGRPWQEIKADFLKAK